MSSIIIVMEFVIIRINLIININFADIN